MADEKSLKGTKLSDLVKYKDDGEKGAKGVKFADLVKDINKTYGAGTIAKASTIESLVLKRIPMGVFVLDALTGGGVPVGRTTQFFGEPSGCKTTLCLKTVASAQKTCRFCVQPVDAHTKKDDHKPEPMACVWIEMESTLDRDWATRMGVDAEKLYVAQPANAEAAGNILQMALQSDDQDVVVIDSLAHMTPGAELENPMENMQVGAMARMLNKMFRTETALMNKRKLTGNGPTVLVINQVREKVGVMYGCVSHRTRVVLGDGSTEKMGRFVNREGQEPVMSLNRATGQIEPATAVRHFKNGRAESFLHFQTTAPNSTGSMSFDLTPNHLVLVQSEGGFADVPAGSLREGDRLVSYASYKTAPYLDDALTGMMMGDGSLRDTGEHCAHYRMMHGPKQKGYLAWKQRLLAPCLGGQSRIDVLGRPEYESTPDVRLARMNREMSGSSNSLLNPAWRGFEGRGPLALALWYLDDGTFSGHYARWGWGKSEISAKSMPVAMLNAAADWVASLGITRPTVGKLGRLLFSGLRNEQLHRLIAPYVCPSMEYKLHPKFRGGPKWTPEGTVTEKTDLEPVIITKISERRARGTDCSVQKYDMEVAGNHTYFVGGYPGVAVHNSPETRPGGKGQAFASSLEIRLAPGKPFYQGANGPIQKAAQDGDRPLFREFNFKVKKAKSAVADVEGSFKLQMSKVEGREIGQTNDEEQVFFFAKKHLLIENPSKGKWLCLGLEDATEEKLQDKIMATEGKFTELRAKTLELVKER